MDLKVSDAAKVGFWVIMAVFFILLMLSYFGVVKFIGKRQDEYRLHFHFASIRGLNKGAKFKINGKEVGLVEMTDISPLSGVSVTVRIFGKGNVVHENAEVIITKESLLGSSYIEVSEPAGGYFDCDADEEPDCYYVKVLKSKVRKNDWLHYFHDGEEKLIGQIVDVEISESGFDRAKVKKIDKSINVDKTYAFVPGERKFWDSGTKKYTQVTYIDVFPPLEEESYFQGSREAGPEDLIAHVDEVVRESGLQLKELNQEILNVLKRFQDLLDDIEGLIDKDAIDELFASVKEQIESIGANVESITVGLADIVDDNKPRITSTMENIESASKSMRDLMEDPELQDSVKNISERIESIADQIEGILADIEEITDDPELKGELKESVHSVRDTLETTKKTVQDLKNRIEKVSDLEFSGEFKSRFRPEKDTYFSGVDFYLYNPEKQIYFTVGLDEIGEDNLLNMQLGFNLDEVFDLRFGVKRSKVGLGLDYHLDNFFIKSDLYDPNDVVFDMYGGIGISDNVFIVVGGESIFNDDIFNLGILYEF
ncbi:MCE family protein [bacterium]|nr:MCE family protein [bacterium]